MSPGRLETFADVFAIAATLLILNVDTQVGEHVDDLGETLLEIWPSYIGYVVSFVTIGRVREPHGEHRPVRRDRRVLRPGELVVRQVPTEGLSRVRYITSKAS